MLNGTQPYKVQHLQINKKRTTAILFSVINTEKLLQSFYIYGIKLIRLIVLLKQYAALVEGNKPVTGEVYGKDI